MIVYLGKFIEFAGFAYGGSALSFRLLTHEHALNKHNFENVPGTTKKQKRHKAKPSKKTKNEKKISQNFELSPPSAYTESSVHGVYLQYQPFDSSTSVLQVEWGE